MAFNLKTCNIIELSGVATDEQRARAIARMVDHVVDNQPAHVIQLQPGFSREAGASTSSKAPSLVPRLVHDLEVPASKFPLDRTQISTVPRPSGSHPEPGFATAQRVTVCNSASNDGVVNGLASDTQQNGSLAECNKAARPDNEGAQRTVAKFGDHSVTLPKTTANIAFFAEEKKVQGWLVHMVQSSLDLGYNGATCTWRPETNDLMVFSDLSSICMKRYCDSDTASMAASCSNLIDRRAYRIPLTMEAAPPYETTSLPMNTLMLGTSSATAPNEKTLAGYLSGKFRFAQGLNAMHLAEIFNGALVATDIVSLFEKGWVQVFRLRYAERSGRQLELGYVSWNDFDWCVHMIEDEVGGDQLIQLITIARNHWPTLIAGLDVTSGQSLAIWRMLASGGVWPVAHSGLHCVADDIVWPKWRLGLVKLQSIDRAILQAITPQLPGSANLVLWLFQLASSRHCHAQLFEGFHRACVLVGSDWKQVPLDADWPKLNEVDSMPTRDNVGQHVGYRLTADQQHILTSKPAVLPAEGKFRAWVEAGHNLTRNDMIVPSVFVVSGYNMLGMSTKLIPTPREANFALRFLAAAVPKEDNAMKDAAMKMVTIRPDDDWDLVMAVMFQVVASCVSTLYMSSNVTGRELSALQANAGDVPGRLKLFLGRLSSGVSGRPLDRGDVFHELVVELIARSTGYAIPPKTLAFSALKSVEFKKEYPPVAQLVLYTSPALPPQPGTVLAMGLITEYPCEWCIPPPLSKADLSEDFGHWPEQDLRPLDSGQTAMYQGNSTPEMFIPYGNQVMNIVAISNRTSLRTHPKEHTLREQFSHYRGPHITTDDYMTRDYAHQPLFIDSLGIFAPGNMLSYYWATEEIAQPMWPQASAEHVYFDEWRRGEVECHCGIFGNNNQPIVPGTFAYKQLLSRMEGKYSSDAQNESAKTDHPQKKQDEEREDDGEEREDNEEENIPKKQKHKRRRI